MKYTAHAAISRNAAGISYLRSIVSVCLFVCLLSPMHSCICGPIRMTFCNVTHGVLRMDMGWGRMWNQPHWLPGGEGQNLKKKAVVEVVFLCHHKHNNGTYIFVAGLMQQF